MLTSDLLRVRVDRSRITCQFVAPDDARAVDLAEQLLAVARLAVSGGWKRAALDEAVDGIASGAGVLAKVARGLAKVIEDHASFDVASPVAPPELRQTVFLAARRIGPLSLDKSLWERPTADDVIAAVAEGLGLTPAAVADALYADLEAEQRITAVDVPDATWLLNRYNIAIVQGVLIRAAEVRLRLRSPTTPKLRQLLRHAKFHQLMHQVWRLDDDVHLVMDGPTSLFSQSTRYGRQLAFFLPAIALQSAWELEATVRWGPQNKEKTLYLSHADGLVSHLRDDGAWASKEQEGFRRRYEEANPPFSLSDQTEPVVLGPRAMVLPDFSFSDGARVAHLEIIGFWRKEYLQRRLEALRRYAPGNLILAVSDKLCGDDHAALDDLPATVIPFAQVVPVKRVLAEIERVAR